MEFIVFYIFSVLMAFVLGLGLNQIIDHIEKWFKNRYEIIVKIKKKGVKSEKER